ncbi:hypothetical protein HDU96_006384 [Phlyctochytrium bullatum]|nr:hypothetical protein HDU96_006384 [Phlyctochytrium bullatum]
MHSLDLLNDLRNRFTEAVSEGLQSEPMLAFFSSCASTDFLDGLRLIPHNHPVLGMRNYSGRTLLEEASFCARHDAVQVLLDLGASVNPPDIPASAPNDCRPPLWCAIHSRRQLDRDLNLPRLLLTHGARHDLEFSGMTPLLDAVSHKRHNLIQLLLSFGADPSAQTSNGLTALELAMGRCDLTATQILLDAGAKVAHPLHPSPLLTVRGGNAADKGDGGAAAGTRSAGGRDRLDAGADLTRRSPVGETALHFVAEVPRWDGALEALLERLLRMGVELNGRDVEGRTALHAAAEKGRKEYMVWLLARDGIEVGLVDDGGKGWVDQP